jgi:antitoxin component YwqK of YwqJK toxin-antitoxin module
MKRTLILIIISTVFSCSTQEINLNELSFKNGAFDLSIYNGNGQDSIQALFKGKPFTGRALGYFGNQQLKYSIDFSKGLIHGKDITYFENGNVRTAYNYNKGLLHGPQIEYFEDGSTKSWMNKKNGRTIGNNLFYHPNGERKATFLLDEKGNENGEFKEYDSLGNLLKARNLFNSENHGVGEDFTYDSDNNFVHKVVYNFINGKAEGSAYTIDSDNDTLLYMNYKNNNQDGVSILLNKSKDTIDIANFKNGQFDGLRKEIKNVKTGEYTLTNYSNGKQEGLPVLYSKNGERVLQKRTNSVVSRNSIQTRTVTKSQTSHVCSYCSKTFFGKGYYLAYTRDGLVMSRSDNKNQELCCSSVCAYKIMEM